MPVFLSTQWVEHLDAALRAAPGLATDRPLVMEQIVGTPDGAEACFQVRFGPEGASAAEGATGDADVTLVTDLATAWSLHLGARRAQDAFAQGDLKVRGRPELLSGRSDLFAALSEAGAALRATTTFPDDR